MALMIPTPRDLFEQLQRVLARAERVRVWNEQMVEVVNVVRQATADGLGVLIRVSHTENTIDAVPTRHCAAGSALVIDRDRLGLDDTGALPLQHSTVSTDLFNDGPADAALRRRALAYQPIVHPRVQTGIIVTPTEA